MIETHPCLECVALGESCIVHSLEVIYMSATRIISCSCVHAYQDERYGEGKRVHNSGAKTTGAKVTYTCTVCGSVK